MFALIYLANAYSQNTKTILHENGKIAFKGEYNFAWQNDQDFELVYKHEQGIKKEDDFLLQLKNFFPEMAFQGKCEFFYPSGQLRAKGTYQYGIKNGEFKLFHENGKLAAQQYYENGMGINVWKTWDEKGTLTGEFHYSTIPDSIMVFMLKNINTNSSMNDDDENTILIKSIVQPKQKVFRLAHYDNILARHRDHLVAFDEFISDKTYHKTLKNGSSIAYKNGKPEIITHFKNNMPDSTWQILKEGQLIFEIVFMDGRAVKAIDFF